MFRADCPENFVAFVTRRISGARFADRKHCRYAICKPSRRDPVLPLRRIGVSGNGALSVGQESCKRCASFAESPPETLKFLRGEQATCDTCPRKATIDQVSRQYKARSSNWWVVKGVVAIPVWIKERLKCRNIGIG
jgi:hypothetical protein